MIDYNELNRKIHEETMHMLNVHDEYKTWSIDELRQKQNDDTNNFYTLCFNISGNVNISTVIRSTCIFGGKGTFIYGRSPFDRRGEVGSRNYIQVTTIRSQPDDNLNFDSNDFISKMKSFKLVPIFCEQGGILVNNYNWDVVDYCNNNNLTPCLVFGNENIGIPSSFMEEVISKIPESLIVSIPQKGVLRSLNVGTCSGIVMYDMCSKKGYI